MDVVCNVFDLIDVYTLFIARSNVAVVVVVVDVAHGKFRHSFDVVIRNTKIGIKDANEQLGVFSRSVLQCISTPLNHIIYLVFCSCDSEMLLR